MRPGQVGAVCPHSAAGLAGGMVAPSRRFWLFDAAWWPKADAAERVAQLAIAFFGLLVLSVALWLQPSPQGLGTHEQMGFAPCGFYVGTGVPCPACGMTTSFSLMVRARVVSAFATQPAGATIALVLMLMCVALPISAWKGRSWSLVLARLHVPFLLALLGLLMGLAWVYKIAVE